MNVTAIHFLHTIPLNQGNVCLCAQRTIILQVSSTFHREAKYTMLPLGGFTGWCCYVPLSETGHFRCVFQHKKESFVQDKDTVACEGWSAVWKSEEEFWIPLIFVSPSWGTFKTILLSRGGCFPVSEKSGSQVRSSKLVAFKNHWPCFSSNKEYSNRLVVVFKAMVCESGELGSVSTSAINLLCEPCQISHLLSFPSQPLPRIGFLSLCLYST